MKKLQNNRFWLETPLWIIVGSIIILLLIFVFWTIESLRNQKISYFSLLQEKGAALIRSFEAGTRTGIMGMMGMRGEQFHLQRLLVETAMQPDIAYIMVVDPNGEIKAANNRERIGDTYGLELDLKALAHAQELQWRQISDSEGNPIFEVFRAFSPLRIPAGRALLLRLLTSNERSASVGDTHNFPVDDQIIFVGLDMGEIEAARKETARNTVITAVILLVASFVGMLSLFLVQAYRSTRSSLARIKAFSDKVVKDMPVGLLGLDTNNNIASSNLTAETVLQMPSSLLIGKSAKEVLPAPIMDLLEETTASGQIADKEIEYVRKDGIKIPLDISVSHLEGDDGSFLGNIILFRDLTEVRALKKEVERSRRLASIGRLAAGVAHEIRNPLSSIKGFATYFGQRYNDNPEDKKTAEIMVKEVERLNRVVGQLLEFARPMDVSKKPVCVRTLVQHSLKMIHGDAAKQNISIQEHSSPDLRDVSLDQDRINQVLLNLYLNAMEAMEDGGVLSVSVDHDNKSQRLRIRVKDTGTGIDRKNMPNIFDPYFTTRQSGTGLGLAIVHKIVESHEGEVTVESEPGKGTTVNIFLPYA